MVLESSDIRMTPELEKILRYPASDTDSFVKVWGWDIAFLRMAREIASWSKDPKRKVGCVIVDNERKPVSYGYNGLPSSIEDHELILQNDDLRRKLMIHAEQNAIYNANRSLEGTSIYIWPFLPCPSCASSILANKFKRVITTKYTPDHWAEDFELSKLILKSRLELNRYEMSKIRKETTEYDPADPKN
jgi:dCMP deaminase